MNSVVNAVSKQFKLCENGNILFQEDASNPTPGKHLAIIKKGSSILSPTIDLVKDSVPFDESDDDVKNKVKLWLTEHLKETLYPLGSFEEAKNQNLAVEGITNRIIENLGIVHRSELENFIKDLDQDARKVLRQNKIRLGPVLVFLPTLNKPAAIHLRAMLFALWNDQVLPAKVPPDGIVSFSIKDEGFNPDYLKTIGYPVYGSRAIRVDMLDRLVGAIYDESSKGKFKAKHEMAEWMGCSIVDLYEVLEAMGHRKVYDPADENLKKDDKENAEQVKVTILPSAEVSSDSNSKSDDNLTEGEIITDKTKTVAKVASEEKTNTDNVKPELATFLLKKGRAYGDRKLTKEIKNKNPPRQKIQKKKRKKSPPDRGPKVISIPSSKKPNPSDSPFAVLGQLQAEKDDKK